MIVARLSNSFQGSFFWFLLTKGSDSSYLAAQTKAQEKNVWAHQSVADKHTFLLNVNTNADVSFKKKKGFHTFKSKIKRGTFNQSEGIDYYR
jgi:hypothetical protein